MFSVREKRAIADGVQHLLASTHHPELPQGPISFTLTVLGVDQWSWAIIRNNAEVPSPTVNPWNEKQDPGRLDGIQSQD